MLYTIPMKKVFLMSLIIFSAVFVDSVHAEGKITSFLKIGTYSPEVKTLQQILNKDPLTKVASYGTGSPGFETNYFGILTHKAVAAFQAKNGLVADGLVGAKTREKLNSVNTITYIVPNQQTIYPYGQNPNLVYPTTTTQTVLPVSTNVSSLSNTEILISSVSPVNPAPGQIVNIFGSGFSENMLAYIDIKNSLGFDFVDSGHIKIKIPAGETEGSKWLSLANAHTDTRWTQPTFVLVTNSPVASSSNQFWDTLKVIERQNNKFLALASEKPNNWEKFKKQFVGIFENSFFGGTKVAYAQVNNFFGGRILSTTPCLCPANPGSIIYLNNLVVGGSSSVGYSNIYSKLHSNYNVSMANVQILGGTTPSTFSCQEPAYPQGCQEIDSADSTIDLLRGVGTTAI